MTATHSKTECVAVLVYFILVEEKGFETLWSHRRRAVDEQVSTGHLHLIVQIPFPLYRNNPPGKGGLFLWRRRRDLERYGVIAVEPSMSKCPLDTCI